MTNLTNLITKGPLKYRYYYNQTMSGGEVAYHTQDVPQALKTLADKHTNTKVIEIVDCRYRDDSAIGLEINNKLWAVEDKEYPYQAENPYNSGKVKRLPNEIWNYLSLALGLHPHAGWDEEQTS